MGEHIERGDVQGAMEKAAQLASQRVRIEKATLENTRNDEEFTFVESNFIFFYFKRDSFSSLTEFKFKLMEMNILAIIMVPKFL